MTRHGHLFRGNLWSAIFPPADAAQSFIAIVSSNTLAATMLKRANGRVDGFVVEGTHRLAATTRHPREAPSRRSR